MLGRKLSEHDRCRFIDETAPGHTQDRMLTLPFKWQFVLVENGQIFISSIFTHAFYC